MIGMARTIGCGPHKISRTNDWLPKTLHFGLVIQDHIESIGKPILLRVGEVLLTEFLAQSA